MNISKISVKATIPTAQYANIQPEIEITGVEDIGRATEVAMTHIKDMFSKYSEKGSLQENNSIEVKAEKASFNESVIINFDPVSHTYMYGDTKLTSATELTKKFYKEFDSENISSVASKSWGVNQNDVKDLWESNGSLTSDFGNVVHKAIELYEKYKSTGAIISNKKGITENYAMPKHPILKSIIKGFEDIKEDSGVIVTEALITCVEKGLTGHADRLDVIDFEKKICNVCDYKINVNSEEVSKELKPLQPFNDLIANKLTKYQIQMSIYANMLQLSGWTVNELIVYVYEDSWKKYKLDILKVIN